MTVAQIQLERKLAEPVVVAQMVLVVQLVLPMEAMEGLDK
jgi:hypothetical protein